MSTESLVEKLTKSLQDAQETLRATLTARVAALASTVGKASPAEVREELDHLADDFIAQFTSAYQEMIAAVEEGLPAGAPARKAMSPRKKSPPKDPATDPVFVRPTYVQRALSAEGLRVAKDARPALMEVLNNSIRDNIARLKDQLPTITKGEHEGEMKRVTIQTEDVEKVRAAPPLPPAAASPGSKHDLAILALGDDAPGYEVAVVLRAKTTES